MDKIVFWLNYFFNPWEKANAYESIMLVTGILYILVLLIMIYLAKSKKANSVFLMLLLLIPAFAVFSCTFFYWYELLLFLLFMYSGSYKETRDNEEFRETWQKNIKLSIALTVVLPVITIMACQWLGFGYKLFP